MYYLAQKVFSPITTSKTFPTELANELIHRRGSYNELMNVGYLSWESAHHAFASVMVRGGGALLGGCRPPKGVTVALGRKSGFEPQPPKEGTFLLSLTTPKPNTSYTSSVMIESGAINNN